MSPIANEHTIVLICYGSYHVAIYAALSGVWPLRFYIAERRKELGVHEDSSASRSTEVCRTAA